MTARPAARNANRQLETVLLLCVGVLIIVWSLTAEFIDFSLRVGSSGVSLRGPVELAVFCVLLSAVSWWVARRLRHTERRFADALPRRVARTRQHTAARVLGVLYLIAALVVYPGGIAVGLWLALFDNGVNRALGGVVAVGAAAMALIAAQVMAEAVRRPALAEDIDSPAADDLLRTEDTHRVAPFPLLVVLVGAVNTAVGSTVMWIMIGYVVVGAAVWALAMLADFRSSTHTAPGSAMGVAR